MPFKTLEIEICTQTLKYLTLVNFETNFNIKHIGVSSSLSAPRTYFLHSLKVLDSDFRKLLPNYLHVTITSK